VKNLHIFIHFKLHTCL